MGGISSSSISANFDFCPNSTSPSATRKHLRSLTPLQETTSTTFIKSNEPSTDPQRNPTFTPKLYLKSQYTINTVSSPKMSHPSDHEHCIYPTPTSPNRTPSTLPIARPILQALAQQPSPPAPRAQSLDTTQTPSDPLHTCKVQTGTRIGPQASDSTLKQLTLEGYQILVLYFSFFFTHPL